MTIKIILVPFYGTDGDRSALETACLIAHRFAGHVDGLHIREEQRLMLSHDDAGFSPAFRDEWLAQMQAELQRQDEKSRATFTSIVDAKSLTYLDQAALAIGRTRPPARIAGGSGQPTASWQTAQGDAADILAEWGGAYDLVVVGKPWGDRTGLSQAGVEGALFGTGRVVLLTPLTPPALGESILIAWNNTAQSARAVASAMPLLEHASHVTILTITTKAKRGPSAQNMARRLAWHGIDATVVELAPDARSVGEVLLDEAKARSADLLVMGAYSHSRLREILLGGVTKHVLAHTELPVLMAH